MNFLKFNERIRKEISCKGHKIEKFRDGGSGEGEEGKEEFNMKYTNQIKQI